MFDFFRSKIKMRHMRLLRFLQIFNIFAFYFIFMEFLYEFDFGKFDKKSASNMMSEIDWISKNNDW